MFLPNAGIDPATLQAFKSQIAFQLPDDYRAFLRDSNGGSFINEYPTLVAETIGAIYCNSLFGLGLNSSLDLAFWWKELDGELLPQSLVIGNDPGGGLFLLSSALEDNGVFYYDHSYFFRSSTDHLNAYPICNNFTTFLGLLKL